MHNLVGIAIALSVRGVRRKQFISLLRSRGTTTVMIAVLMFDEHVIIVIIRCYRYVSIFSWRVPSGFGHLILTQCIDGRRRQKYIFAEPILPTVGDLYTIPDFRLRSLLDDYQGNCIHTRKVNSGIMQFTNETDYLPANRLFVTKIANIKYLHRVVVSGVLKHLGRVLVTFMPQG